MTPVTIGYIYAASRAHIDQSFISQNSVSRKNGSMVDPELRRQIPPTRQPVASGKRSGFQSPKNAAAKYVDYLLEAIWQSAFLGWFGDLVLKVVTHARCGQPGPGQGECTRRGSDGDDP
jgi:hypothetical protein